MATPPSTIKKVLGVGRRRPPLPIIAVKKRKRF
jgi:hypothetical protein